MTEIIMLYITAKDRQEAHLIATTLLEEKLIACANIYAEVQSIYRWQSKVVEDHESTFWIKTTKDLQSTVIDRIKELHSYECPCIVVLDIVDGHTPFLAWVKESCRP